MPSPDSNTPPSEKDIFCRALEIEDLRERDSFLKQSCGDNHELRQRIERLLALSAEDDDLLNEEQYPILQSERDSLESELAGDKEFLGDLGNRIERIGDYQLIEELGRGSAGVVFKATQLSLNRTVALKIILGARLASDSERERFRVEAKAAAQLNHPNVVAIYEVGRFEDRDFYSMPFIAGSTLGEVVKANALPIRETVSLVIKITRAIQAAHQAGILHRDLTPNNILLDETHEPHIADFGLAYNLRESNALTQVGQIIGTPHYMSPEQAYGSAEKITTAADIYSLGSILYELLTGHTVFDGETVLDTLDQVKNQDPVPPKRHNKAIDSDLETIILKCLEKEPLQRYRSAAALADDLEAWLEHRPISARPASGVQILKKWIVRHPVHFALIVAVLLLVGTLGIAGPFMAWQQSLLRQDAEYAQTIAEKESSRANAAYSLAQERADRNQQLLYYSNMNLAAYAVSAPGIYPIPKDLLTPWIPQPGEADMRGWEWYYLASSVKQAQGEIEGTGASIQSIQLSPNGQYLAVICETQSTISIRDGNTGNELHLLTGHTQEVTDISWSPNSRKLASSSEDGTVKTWDVASATLLHSTAAGRGKVDTVAWSPDGRQLATGGGPAIDLLNAQDLRKNRKIEFRQRGKISQLRWSPDGSHLAAVVKRKEAEDSLMIWAANGSSDSLTPLPNSEGGIECMAWSSDGSILAAGMKDRTLSLWSGARGRPQALPPIQDVGKIKSLAWSHDDSMIVVGSKNREIAIWDSRKGKKLKSIFGHASGVLAVQWSLDDTAIYSGDQNGNLKIWHPKSDLKPQSFKNKAGVHAVQWSPDGTFAAVGLGDGSLRMLNLENATWGPPLSQSDKPQYNFGWSPDGRYFAMKTSESELAILDWDSRQPAFTIPLSSRQKKSKLNALAWSPDGQHLLLSKRNDALEIWDLGTGEQTHRHTIEDAKQNKARIHALSWSPDGQRIAACGERLFCYVYDLSKQQTLFSATHTSRNQEFTTVTWQPTGSQIAVGGADGSITLINAGDGTREHRLSGHTGIIRSLAWHPSGNRLASGSNDLTVKIWDNKTARDMLTLQEHNGDVKSVCWSRDGKRLLSAGMQGAIRIWDATKAYGE